MAFGIVRRPTAALAVLLIIGTAAPGSHAAALQNSKDTVYQRDSETGSNGPQPSPSICLSKGCVDAAYHLLNKMDTSVDPCDDFYSFACGTFIDRTVIPDDKVAVSERRNLWNEVLLDMRKLVDAPVGPEDSPATAMLKKYFTSCMDEAGIEQKGLEPMKGILQKMGGWPVLEGLEWNESAFDWTEVIYKNHELGFPNGYLFTFSVIEDVKNYSRHMVELDEASLGFNRNCFIKGLNDSDVQSYYNYMVDMAVLMGAEPETAKSEMEDALRFEINLANISLPAEQRRNISQLYNRRTLDELSLVAPAVPWVTYANRQLQPAGHTVFGNESVNVVSVDYFKSLNTLLETTPKRVLANYMLWRAVDDSVNYLNMAARDTKLKFSGQVSGTTAHQPRWRDCLHDTTEIGTLRLSGMDVATGSLYAKNHFDKESKKAALELVADIHQQFNVMLQEVNWMDDATKLRAMEKSEAIEYYVGYPDELLNDTLVSEYYKDLNITDEDYFQNTLNVRTVYTNKEYKKLREPLDKNDWKRHSKAAYAGAFYTHEENSINFPAGILRGAYFDKDRPKYLNYGSIGFSIGHEITHGFDDQGRQYDSTGNLREWWEPETRTKFLERAQCIIEQYGNITVQRVNMSVNGIVSQGENIADNGGIQMARRAYEVYQQKAGREPALPGLQQYSNEQMFWLGTASGWCAKLKDQILRWFLVATNYPPPFIRINKSLRNTRQFTEDWQCPLGSRMHPADRCGVW